MDDRNLELEAWLIETAGEEMMANHLGPDWNKFNEEFGFYPNMGMTVADLVWQHQQAKVEELERIIKLRDQQLTEETGLSTKYVAKCAELQKQLSEYIFVAETLDEMYVKEVQKSDDLQTRVDKAIRLLVEAELYQSEPNIDLAVKELKGEG